jgi:predicted ATP-grasp superfamily ATP-dependent carboligase
MSGSRQERIAVVVLGSGHHGGVAIARSLGRLGVPVYSVDSQWHETAFSSRYCRGRWILDWANDAAGDCLSRMLSIGGKIGGRPFLIPVTDPGAIWVAEHAEALQEEFRFEQLDPGLVRTLCDKSRMQKLADRCGIRVSPSLLPHCRESLDVFVSNATFPMVVKATDAERLRARTGGTKFIVRDRSELETLFEKAWDGQSSNFLVQEFIPGDDWMFDGYFDHNSECLFGVTAKKIRRFPARTGVTSLGVCLKNDVVEGLSRKFMHSIGYRGIVDMGFRFDQRTSEYTIMDVNPRIGSSFRLFTDRGGTDVARAYYLHQTGCPIPASNPCEGRKWITEDFDLLTSMGFLWNGALPLREWLASFKGVEELACFALDDPFPAAMMAIADCWEFCKWMRRREATRQPDTRVSAPAMVTNLRRR